MLLVLSESNKILKVLLLLLATLHWLPDSSALMALCESNVYYIQAFLLSG